jgi:hypothetical protein
MTVQELYKKTKAWMFEKPSSTIYDNYIIEITNKVLAELYEENNMCRMFKGKAPFIDGITAHLVENMDDVLDYEDEYLYDVIPKGVDANFLMDDDLSKMSIYQTEYNNARVAHQCMLSSDIVEELTEKAKEE